MAQQQLISRKKKTRFVRPAIFSDTRMSVLISNIQVCKGVLSSVPYGEPSANVLPQLNVLTEKGIRFTSKTTLQRSYYGERSPNLLPGGQPPRVGRELLGNRSVMWIPGQNEKYSHQTSKQLTTTTTQ